MNTAERLKSGNWEDASPLEFVELYETMHRKVYDGVAPVWRKQERKQAAQAAGEMLDRDFGGDPAKFADFIRWVWIREERRIAWSKTEGIAPGSFRIHWRAQFTDARLLNDYRVANPDQNVGAAAEEEHMADPSDWRSRLLLTEKGKPTATLANVLTILANDEPWKGVLAFDAFAAAVITKSAPPWGEDDAPAEARLGGWSDADTSRLCAWLARVHDVSVSSRVALEAVIVAAERDVFHPVRSYLKGLQWDGVRRLDDWLTVVCGAEDSPFVRAVGAKFLISAVARVMRPGCKVDHVPVFEGKQGVGKSTLLRMLAGDDWFLETSMELGSKDSFQALRSKWIVELAELDALRRTDVSRTKAFITAQCDTYRQSYGRITGDFRRQCVFAGTTNAGEYLRDETGNRRFWPVRIERVAFDVLGRMRDQLWAEATARFERGDRWHIDDPALLAVAEAEQEARYAGDPWEEAITAWLDDPMSPERRRVGVTTAQVLAGALNIDAGKWTRSDETRAGASLRRLGWCPRQVRQGTARVRHYLPEVVTKVGTSETSKKQAQSQLSQPSQPNYSHTRIEDRDRDPIERVCAGGCDVVPGCDIREKIDDFQNGVVTNGGGVVSHHPSDSAGATQFIRPPHRRGRHRR
jgi:predicted P-loop ATPase